MGGRRTKFRGMSARLLTYSMLPSDTVLHSNDGIVSARKRISCSRLGDACAAPLPSFDVDLSGTADIASGAFDFAGCGPAIGSLLSRRLQKWCSLGAALIPQTGDPRTRSGRRHSTSLNMAPSIAPIGTPLTSSAFEAGPRSGLVAFANRIQRRIRSPCRRCKHPTSS